MQYFESHQKSYWLLLQTTFRKQKAQMNRNPSMTNRVKKSKKYSQIKWVLAMLVISETNFVVIWRRIEPLACSLVLSQCFHWTSWWENGRHSVRKPNTHILTYKPIYSWVLNAFFLIYYVRPGLIFQPKLFSYLASESYFFLNSREVQVFHSAFPVWSSQLLLLFWVSSLT